MNIDKNFIIKRILPLVAGGGLGYAYYYFVGCSTGSCPISSNPYVSTIYGAVLGFLIVVPSKKKVDTKNGNN